jgi:hypothetical protein
MIRLQRAILILLFCIPFSGSAQQFSFPVIKSSGKSITEFIPENWLLIAADTGDLNKDKQEDIVLIIETKDTVSEMQYNADNGKWDQPSDTKPRILIILFQRNNEYKLALRNNDFILRMDEGGVWGDPLDEVSVKNNVLTIAFFGGASTKWRNTYKFRFQKNDWYLIGVTSGNYNSILGTMNENDYNFITKKVRITSSDNIFDDHSKTNTQWKTFILKELKTMKTLIRPFTWEIDEGIYI